MESNRSQTRRKALSTLHLRVTGIQRQIIQSRAVMLPGDDGADGYQAA